MTGNKLTMILDTNDILFSTQYIYLSNMEESLNSSATDDIVEEFNKIKAYSKLKNHSFFQSLVHRELEEIVNESEFFDVMKLAEFNKKLENGIKLSTPYSQYMMNLHRIAVESTVIVCYANEIEKFLLETRLKDLVNGSVLILSREEMHTRLSNISSRNEVALYTSDSSLVERYRDRIDIMIPATLRYLKKYHDLSGVYPLTGLWSHVK